MNSKVILLSLTISLLFSCGTTKNSVSKVVGQNSDKINSVMDTWHEDVINSDLDSYFNVMGESFIFLGTDPKERWSKDEFYKFFELSPDRLGFQVGTPGYFIGCGAH